MNRIASLSFVAIGALMLSSCMTVRFIGPTEHVDFDSRGKLRSSRQLSALKEGKDAMVSTYDQENSFDDKGNLVKVKLTEYIERLSTDKKFIVWETESKVIGGNLVPWRLSANGVPFVEIEYQLFPVSAKGAVSDAIPDKVFPVLATMFLGGENYTHYKIGLDRHSVSFRSDDHFVTEIKRFSPYYGMSTENVLTLGWDNIVLKRFYFSNEKLAEGIAKSYNGYNSDSEMYKQMAKDDNIEYVYDWTQIGDKICQNKMTFKDRELKLEAQQEFDAAGNRTKETWFVTNLVEAKSPALKIFEQTLGY